jgi:hypothetical protein
METERTIMTAHKIPKEHIEDLMAHANYEIWDSQFGSCTIVAMTLPNGYTLVESSGCIDPNEYDHYLGVELCKAALERRVWQLEGYLGKQKFYEETKE